MTIHTTPGFPKARNMKQISKNRLSFISRLSSHKQKGNWTPNHNQKEPHSNSKLQTQSKNKNSNYLCVSNIGLPQPVSPTIRVTRFSRIFSTILFLKATTGRVEKLVEDSPHEEDSAIGENSKLSLDFLQWSKAEEGNRVSGVFSTQHSMDGFPKPPTPIMFTENIYLKNWACSDQCFWNVSK